MFSTKFTNDLEDWPARLAKWSWLVFTICLFAAARRLLRRVLLQHQG